MRCFYRSGVECTNDVQDLLPAARSPHAHHVDSFGPFPAVPLRQLTLRLTLSSSLSPATDQVRLAFGGDPAEVLCRSGDAATRKRYTWLEKALARVTDAQREAFVRTDVVLDGERLVHDASTCAGHGHTTCPGDVAVGELLVYDECETREGKYDELGTGRGISAFGTIFWLRTSEDGSPSRYSRRDARRHYEVKVFDVLRYGDEDVLHRPFHERRALLESGRRFPPAPVSARLPSSHTPQTRTALQPPFPLSGASSRCPTTSSSQTPSASTCLRRSAPSSPPLRRRGMPARRA